MTQIFNTRILLSLGVIVAVSAALISATGAFFTDTEVSTSNTFAAGTLQLEVNGNNSVGTFSVDLGNTSGMMPGDETGEGAIVIGNRGSSNLGWVGYFTTTGDTVLAKKVYIKEMQMEFFRPDTSSWEPTDHFISNGVGSGTYAAYYNTLAASDTNIPGKISLETFNDVAKNNMMGVGGGVFMGALKPGYTYRLTFTLALDESADNTYQGKSMNIGYTANATQINVDALAAMLSSGAPLTGAGAAASHFSWMNTQITNQN